MGSPEDPSNFINAVISEIPSIKLHHTLIMRKNLMKLKLLLVETMINQ